MGKNEWQNTRLDGKVVVITGASAGLGKMSALDLARRGAKVYMLGRNKEKTEAAASYVISESGANPEMVQIMLVDLASIKSVREFAEAFKKRESKIDILMNNAGVYATDFVKTVDGYELHFHTNVLSHFLLTHLLISPLIAAAPGSRIVNLSSYAHKLGKKDIQWDDINFENSFSAMDVYAHSKLANILFNLELSKRVKESGITCYAVHPGFVHTEMGRNLTGCLSCMLSCLKPCQRTPEKGAMTQIRCSVDPVLSEETGQYYENCKRSTATRQATNEESAKRLWDMCADMVHLQPEEIHPCLT